MSGQDSRLLGRWGEQLAAAFYRRQGGEILQANWRCRFGEIDLIVREGNFLCFVEVKLRKTRAYGSAGEFVDARKQQKLRATAQSYLLTYETTLQPRFDVIEIYAPEGLQTKTPQIFQIKDAF